MRRRALRRRRSSIRTINLGPGRPVEAHDPDRCEGSCSFVARSRRRHRRRCRGEVWYMRVGSPGPAHTPVRGPATTATRRGWAVVVRRVPSPRRSVPRATPGITGGQGRRGRLGEGAGGMVWSFRGARAVRRTGLMRAVTAPRRAVRGRGGLVCRCRRRCGCNGAEGSRGLDREEAPAHTGRRSAESSRRASQGRRRRRTVLRGARCGGAGLVLPAAALSCAVRASAVRCPVEARSAVPLAASHDASD